MKCSICIATYNKPKALRKTLKSIFSQKPSFDFEVIVVDDGSEDPEAVKVACHQHLPKDHPVAFRRITISRKPGYRNPSVARNVAYKAARGEVLICQSDDVMHTSPHCIQRLVDDLESQKFLIATVFNVNENGILFSEPNGKGYGDRLQVYTSPEKQRPLFFLGSVLREHVYAIGGNDEEFTAPSREDVWFAACLRYGAPKLQPQYSTEIIGHHQAHEHCDPKLTLPSREVFRRKMQEVNTGAEYQASGGPWPFVAGQPFVAPDTP